MPAAVHRSADEREQWNPPPESVTPAEALVASTDGHPSLGVGSRGDLVPLDGDPPGATAGSAEALAYSGVYRSPRPSSAASSPNRGL
jgi:hypothetical protein